MNFEHSNTIIQVLSWFQSWISHTYSGISQISIYPFLLLLGAVQASRDQAGGRGEFDK